MYNPTQFVATEEVKKSASVVKEGYLFKKGSQVVKPSWDRRYFVIQGDLLTYYTRGKDEDPIVATNLRLCSVRPSDNPERRFCFSVMSPIRSYHLQAETEEDYFSWMVVLQNSIALGTFLLATADFSSLFAGLDAAFLVALNSERSPDDSSHEYGLKKEKKERLQPVKIDTAGSSGDIRKKKSPSTEKAEQDYAAAIQEIRSQPGNNACADCGIQGNPYFVDVKTLKFKIIFPIFFSFFFSFHFKTSQILTGQVLTMASSSASSALESTGASGFTFRRCGLSRWTSLSPSSLRP